MKDKSWDEGVYKMLITESARCESMIKRVAQEIITLPKGSLGKKKVKTVDGREYISFCLRYREASKVKTVHVPKDKLPEIEQALLRKKRLQETIKSSEKRIKTIRKLLKGVHT